MLVLSNKWYNRLKWTITVVLPAVGVLYLTIATAWGFDQNSAVNGTINAVIGFLGLLLAKSTSNYNKTENTIDGDLVVTRDEDDTYLGLALNKDVSEVTTKSQVKLNVLDTDPRLEKPE
jgi:uncharacterized membrane protein